MRSVRKRPASRREAHGRAAMSAECFDRRRLRLCRGRHRWSRRGNHTNPYMQVINYAEGGLSPGICRHHLEKKKLPRPFIKFSQRRGKSLRKSHTKGAPASASPPPSSAYRSFTSRKPSCASLVSVPEWGLAKCRREKLVGCQAVRGLLLRSNARTTMKQSCYTTRSTYTSPPKH